MPSHVLLCNIYRPNEAIPPSMLLPCVHCHGLYNRRKLTVHVHKCKSRPQGESCKNVDANVRMLISTFIPETSEEMKSTLRRMRDDHITNLVKNDSLILSYGQTLLTKFKHSGDQNKYIREKMRELGYYCDIDIH